MSIVLLIAALSWPVPGIAEPLELSLASTLPANLDFGAGTKAFPSETRPWLQAAARSALAVVRKRIPGDPPCGIRPIECVYCQDDPLTVVPNFDPSTYWIRLNVGGLYYCQLVYQLSHELGHVMFDPRRTNGLIETLCDSLAYQSLDDCGELWAANPPYPNWKEYHQEFHRYRMNDEAAKLAKFPPEVGRAVTEKRWSDVELYLRYRQADLDRDPYSPEGKALRGLAAMALLSDAVPWESFVGIASYTDPPPSASSNFSKTLSTDLLRVPIAVLPALRRIGRARTEDFVAVQLKSHPSSLPKEFLHSFSFVEGDHVVLLAEFANPRGSASRKISRIIKNLHPIETPFWAQGISR